MRALRTRLSRSQRARGCCSALQALACSVVAATRSRRQRPTRARPTKESRIMGIHTIKMPDIGEGIAEVELVAWRVQPGDVVAEDQILVDVMTDKATVEIPSPVVGKVLALGGAVGQVLAVGAELIRLEVAGAGNVSAAAPAPAKILPPVEAAQAAPAAPAKPVAESAPQPKAVPEKTPAPQPQAQGAAHALRQPGDKQIASRSEE